MLSRCMPFTRSLMIWPPRWSGRSPAQKEEPVEGLLGWMAAASWPASMTRLASRGSVAWQYSVARGRQLLCESRPQVEPIINSHSIHKPQARVFCVSYQELREIQVGHNSFSGLTHVVWVSHVESLVLRAQASQISIEASQNPISTQYLDNAQRNLPCCPVQSNPPGYSKLLVSLIATSSSFNRTVPTLRRPVNYQQQ